MQTKLSKNAYHDQIEIDLVDYIVNLWKEYNTKKGQ